MKKTAALFVVMVAMLTMFLAPQASHAFTPIASCSGSSSIDGCSVTFVALLNVETTHVRVIPAVTFLGSAVTQIFEVGNPTNQVNYESSWITGRVQVDGPTYSGPFQLLAGHTYTLLVSTSAGSFPGFGSVKGVLEV